jgi:hypothetical protein
MKNDFPGLANFSPVHTQTNFFAARSGLGLQSATPSRIPCPQSPTRDLSTGLFEECRHVGSRTARLVVNSLAPALILKLCGSRRRPISVLSENGNTDYLRANPFGSGMRLTR